MRFLTAGESHGQALVVILEGLPAHLLLTEEFINAQLRRRQVGYGRSERMEIERDQAEILSGVRFGRTLGSPISMLIRNKDWANWTEKMSVAPLPEEVSVPPVEIPRPGHADLAGLMKYDLRDVREVLERASARETAARVATGAVAKKLLEEFDIRVISHVVQIGSAKLEASPGQFPLAEIEEKAEESDVRCVNPEVAEKMRAETDKAREAGDTVGGVFEVIAEGVPPGLGSYAHWDRRLDGLLAQAVMSIPAVKGVELGLGFRCAELPGSQVHDEIFYDSEKKTFYRKQNNAGGLEGGVTNGQPVVIRAAMKPISTLIRPLRSVNLRSKEQVPAHSERSDVCAVPAAGVVAEAMLAWILATTFLEKFSSDTMGDLKAAYEQYRRRLTQL